MEYWILNSLDVPADRNTFLTSKNSTALADPRSNLHTTYGLVVDMLLVVVLTVVSSSSFYVRGRTAIGYSWHRSITSEGVDNSLNVLSTPDDASCHLEEQLLGS